MAKPIGWIAGIVIGSAFLVSAGCESAPEPKYGSGTPPPDGVDYIMAVQCGGLLLALDRVWPNYPQLRSQAGLYREWAEVRAREAGQNSDLVMPDMIASREDFLRGAGDGTREAQRTLLTTDYSGQVRSCRALADAADFVMIGG